MADTAYATIGALKAIIGKSTSGDDANLQMILNAAAARIDRHCRVLKPSGARDFFVADSTASAKLYVGTGTAILPIDECVSVTLVEEKASPSDTTYTAWAADDWLAASGDRRMPDFNRTPYTFLVVSATGNEATFTSGQYTAPRGFKPEVLNQRGVPTIRVTAKWGYATAVPDDIKLATLMTASRWYKLLQGAMSRQLAVGDLGLATFPKQLDPDVVGILVEGRYVRPSVG